MAKFRIPLVEEEECFYYDQNVKNTFKMLISVVNDSQRKLAGILGQKFNHRGDYKYY